MKRTVRGYHGTTEEAYQKILEEGMKPSTGKDCWLGQGVYFFQDDIREAKRWAVCHFPDESELRVISADITSDTRKTLNLDTSMGHDYVVSASRSVIKELRRKGIRVSSVDTHQLHCIILDTIPVSKIEVIISSFLRKRTRGITDPEVFNILS